MFDCCRCLLELAFFFGWLLGGSADPGAPVCCPYSTVEEGCACKTCVCGQGKGKCCCGEPCQCPNCPGKTACAMPAPCPVSVYVNGVMPDPAPLTPPPPPPGFVLPLPSPLGVGVMAPPPPPPCIAPPPPPCMAPPPGNTYEARLRVCHPGKNGTCEWIALPPVTMYESTTQTIKVPCPRKPEEPAAHD